MFHEGQRPQRGKQKRRETWKRNNPRAEMLRAFHKAEVRRERESAQYWGAGQTHRQWLFIISLNPNRRMRQ